MGPLVAWVIAAALEFHATAGHIMQYRNIVVPLSEALVVEAEAGQILPSERRHRCAMSYPIGACKQKASREGAVSPEIAIYTDATSFTPASASVRCNSRTCS